MKKLYFVLLYPWLFALVVAVAPHLIMLFLPISFLWGWFVPDVKEIYKRRLNS
jgi:hypothetical protein